VIALVRRSVFPSAPKIVSTIARIVTRKGQPQQTLRRRTFDGTPVARLR
jgi:hypothetical protein